MARSVFTTVSVLDESGSKHILENQLFFVVGWHQIFL
jgi:hypothetical protein